LYLLQARVLLLQPILERNLVVSKQLFDDLSFLLGGLVRRVPDNLGGCQYSELVQKFVVEKVLELAFVV
jgi:hypothetical protein